MHGGTAGFSGCRRTNTNGYIAGFGTLVALVVQVAEPSVLLQQLGLGLVLADLGLRDLEAALEVDGGLVRLAHTLVALLEVFLERLDGLVAPIDLVLGDGAERLYLIVEVLKFRVAPLQVGVTARQLGRRLVECRLDLWEAGRERERRYRGGCGRERERERERERGKLEREGG